MKLLWEKLDENGKPTNTYEVVDVVGITSISHVVLVVFINPLTQKIEARNIEQFKGFGGADASIGTGPLSGLGAGGDGAVSSENGRASKRLQGETTGLREEKAGVSGSISRAGSGGEIGSGRFNSSRKK